MKRVSPIRSPSIESLRKHFKLTLADAKLLKAAFYQGVPKTAMRLANKFIGGYGVESLYPEASHIYFVNIGDTYSKTLVYNLDKNYVWVGSWGDWVEKNVRYK